MSGGRRGAARVRRAGMVGLAALALLATGTACSGGDSGGDGTVTIRYTWWGNADRAELVQQAIDLFEERNPNIDVQPSFSEFEAYWQKLATESAGGGEPDVIQMDMAYLREYADKGVLLDLSQGEAAENLNTDDFRGGLADAGRIDGALYGVPVGGNVFSLIYNPAVFEQAGAPMPEVGWTWEQYWEAFERIDAETDIKGGSGYAGVFYALEMQLRQQGAALFTEDGELGFTREQLADFLQQEVDLREDGLTVDPQRATELKPVSPIGGDISASEFTWDNFLTRYAGETTTELALGPVPTFDPASTGQYLKASQLMSVSARSEHPAEAAMLIDFMVNDPEVAKIIGANRGMPPTNAQLEAVEFEGVDAMVAEYEERMAEFLAPAPPAPPAGAGTIEASLLRIGEDLSYGEITVDEAVDQFFTEAEDTLAG
ncbi:ABC transporter substrate-binding protein [Allostreptomyces psammosilenae]|uniref:Multiple sugar transport system substrate-binding protein n=1 Tax=Allostreptomyces psammosilenae TaxID=1892865 RepID=A0A853A9T2_9ACTN|nr:extracellular solute-binding protein [Allostreptomyces psammosilenae]NYI07268.1 multiple sugar transport system substrate-binding protein [Allostreptomyces psammosilenae]